MAEQKANPVESLQNLRERVERLVLSSAAHRGATENQLSLDFPGSPDSKAAEASPKTNIGEFLGFFSAALPYGEVYLFGGVLRDLALFGRRGFSSDIDLVVEGDWHHCVPYLRSLGASRNKFGGYRLEVDGWPIDIWHARDTWAIRQGLVPYQGIASLTKTTILNWDAILMNWRTRNFIAQEGYLDAIKSRVLDVVLERNPNPLGTAVRVFRHLSVKDAKKLGPAAVSYLANCTTRYRFEEIHSSEVKSYGSPEISHALYRFFQIIKENEHLDPRSRYKVAGEKLLKDGLAVSHEQAGWDFDELVENY
jgi:hypothetical protein